MRTRIALITSLLGALLLASGCTREAPTSASTSPEPAAKPAAPAEAPPAQVEPAVEPPAQASPAEAASPPAEPPAAIASPPAPASSMPEAAQSAAAQGTSAATPMPARPAAAPGPARVVTTDPAATKEEAAPAAEPRGQPAAAAVADLDDPGGAIAVAATRAGLTRVGSEECADCHDVQYTSWSESRHAARRPPLDCENCHGPGSEYKAKAVMKDAAKARAAGLVIPDAAFCGKCHKKGVDDAFLGKAHAHEE